MESGTKAALVLGGAAVVTIGILAWLESRASAAPPIGPKGKFCPDGTPAPNDDPTQCPPPHPGQNPYSPPGGWQYSGDPTKDYLPSAALLARVDPCSCANVGLVRRFQAAAGLVQAGKSDGRYGPDVQKALQNAIADIAGQGYDVSGLSAPAPCENAGRPSWWGAVGAYTNPTCPGDPGPTYA